MKRKPFTSDFTDPIYRMCATIIQCDRSEFESFAKKTLSEDAFYAMKEHGSFNLNDTTRARTTYIHGGFCLWFPWNVRLTTVIHECLHLVAIVLRERGLALTCDSEEAYTYYMEWVFEAIEKRIHIQRGQNR